MADEYNKELCDEKHKDGNDKFKVIFKRLDDKVEKGVCDVTVKTLVDKVDSVVAGLSWTNKLVIGSMCMTMALGVLMIGLKMWTT